MRNFQAALTLPRSPCRYQCCLDLQDVKAESFTAHGGTLHLSTCLNTLENVIHGSQPMLFHTLFSYIKLAINRNVKSVSAGFEGVLLGAAPR